MQAFICVPSLLLLTMCIPSVEVAEEQLLLINFDDRYLQSVEKIMDPSLLFPPSNIVHPFL